MRQPTSPSRRARGRSCSRRDGSAVSASTLPERGFEPSRPKPCGSSPSSPKVTSRRQLGQAMLIKGKPRDRGRDPNAAAPRRTRPCRRLTGRRGRDSQGSRAPSMRNVRLRGMQDLGHGLRDRDKSTQKPMPHHRRAAHEGQLAVARRSAPAGPSKDGRWVRTRDRTTGRCSGSPTSTQTWTPRAAVRDNVEPAPRPACTGTARSLERRRQRRGSSCGRAGFLTSEHRHSDAAQRGQEEPPPCTPPSSASARAPRELVEAFQTRAGHGRPW